MTQIHATTVGDLATLRRWRRERGGRSSVSPSRRLLWADGAHRASGGVRRPLQQGSAMANGDHLVMVRQHRAVWARGA